MFRSSYVTYEVHPEIKFQSRLVMVRLVGRECACVVVEKEYVGLMQCSFSLSRHQLLHSARRNWLHWYCLLPTARYIHLSDFYVEDRSGRPSVVTPALVGSARQAVLHNRRFTSSELSGQFPQIWQLHECRSWRETISVHHVLLAMCNNYCSHKTETALHYSHILPLYCYACVFLSY